MRIEVQTTSASRARADAAIVLGADGESLAKAVRSLGKEHAAAYRTVKDRGGFTGGSGQVIVLYGEKQSRVPAVVLAGLGKAPGRSALCEAAGSAVRAARDAGAKRVVVLLPMLGKTRLDSDVAEAVAEGLLLGLYRFETYKGERSKQNVEEIAVLVDGADERRVTKAVREAGALAGGVALARDLGNEPSNVATPSYLAETAVALAEREETLSVRILDEDEMSGLGMGSLLGVSKGSAEPAKLIVLTHTPKRKSGGRVDTVAIVGKGITFDTGGISIKPSARLEDMKFDMCGGAAVIGAMQAIAQLNVGVRVVGIVPAVENMPGGAAYKPGDILTAMNGTTIEVKNTDAEGRLILADALAYAATKLKPKPKAVVDLATLTGAVVVGLGREHAALVGNNDLLAERLLDAAARSGDALWRLPLTDGYRKQLESAYADVSNLGTPGAGTITAAAFLEKFTGDLRWCHLDIAGMAWTENSSGTATRGATGFGVRVLARLLQGW